MVAGVNKKKLKEKLRRQQIGSGGMFAALGEGW